MTKISICIPTYNRSKFLSELLDSIIEQDLHDIEVVVSDDASQDNTKEILDHYSNLIPLFKYIVQPKNIGLDQNFLAVVEEASGEYVWLMGDDDKLEKGGIAKVISHLHNWPTVLGLTLGVINYDSEMTTRTGIQAMPATCLMHGIDKVFTEIPQLLGFMSALVIKRSAWLEVARSPEIQDFMKYYVQVYIIGKCLQKYPVWGIIQEPCVSYRSDNDQFLSKLGWLKRLKVDVVAYNELEGALLTVNKSARKLMRKKVFQTHIMARLHNAKSMEGKTPDTMAAVKFLFANYGSTRYFWFKALPIILSPNWAVRNARVAYKRFNKSSGAARVRRLT